MIQSNIKYENEFNIAKQEYIDSLPSEIDKNKLISSLNFKIQNNQIPNNQIKIINQYTKYVLECFGYIQGGLCIPSSICLLEVVAVVTKQKYAFLTFGKIQMSETGKDVFNVQNKEKCKKILKSGVVGNDIHTWITLANGVIIDPSIDDSKPVIGSPYNLINKYKYSPYVITDLADTTEYYNISHDELKKWLKNKIKKVKRNYID